MVRRKLNTPTYKFGNFPVFWLREFATVQWHCHGCDTLIPKGSVAFEIFVRAAAKVNPEDLEEMRKLKNFRGLKKYICLDCAYDMLQTSLQDVQLLRSQGVDGFLLMKGI